MRAWICIIALVGIVMPGFVNSEYRVVLSPSQDLGAVRIVRLPEGIFISDTPPGKEALPRAKVFDPGNILVWNEAINHCSNLTVLSRTDGRTSSILRISNVKIEVIGDRKLNDCSLDGVSNFIGRGHTVIVYYLWDALQNGGFSPVLGKRQLQRQRKRKLAIVFERTPR